MKKHLQVFIVLIFLCIQGLSSTANDSFSIAGCSVAGTASLQQDSICYEDTTVLNLTGYTGTIQWQIYNGTSWSNATGAGSTSDAYSVVPGATTEYRAVVTNGACAADTSNSITITVGTIPVPTGVGSSRCGPGQITLTGSGNGTLQWYATASGGSILGTGSPFTTYVPGTTTLYLSDNTSGGSGGSSPILVTAMETAVDDFIEIQNVSNQPVDVTGWKVAVSNDYGDINVVHPTVQILSGIMQPGDMRLFADNTTTPNATYWGSNLLFNPGSYPGFTGWVMILDANDNPVEFIALNWLESDIQGMTAIVDGVPVTISSSLWTGDGIDISNSSGTAEPERQGNLDNNNNSDFILASPSFGVINPGLILPFSGFGCSSPRIPVIATVTFADPVTVSAVPPALCQGNSSVMTATSNNTNYSYTWSPATGLSSTTGASVTATPSAPTSYVVVGDDGTCANIDTVFMDVGPASASGTASSSLDTICVGGNSILTVTGSVGNIQWQLDTGSGFQNIPGGISATLNVTPAVSTLYQAVVTSGGCDPDTSIVLSVAVLTVSDPVVNDTTVCANSTVALSAAGSATIAWYNSLSGGAILYTGNPFIANVIGDTTFYAAEKGGTTVHIGPLNNTIGNSAQSAIDGYGLGFDVIRLCVLERVFVYPTQSGSLTINLRNVQGGTILETRTLSITASATKTPVALGWTLNPGTNYRLEITTGSVPLKYNHSGTISYPYTTANGPLSITGFLTPFFNTGTQYYYFYDWEVFEGCYSNRVPLNVTTTPAQPVITQAGAVLTSSAASGNQWYLNGNIITGATSQTYIATQTGLYSVLVTLNNCTALGTLNVTFIGIDELQNAGIMVYPNPMTDHLIIDFKNNFFDNLQVRLMNATGEIVFESNKANNVSNFDVDTKQLSSGVYLLELITNDNLYRKTLVKN